MKRKTKIAASDKDIQQLAMSMQNIIDSGYATHTQLYKVNFIRGLVFGFGSALGATLLIAVLAWVLTLFQEIPVLGTLSERIQTTIEAKE